MAYRAILLPCSASAIPVAMQLQRELSQHYRSLVCPLEQVAATECDHADGAAMALSLAALQSLLPCCQAVVVLPTAGTACSAEVEAACRAALACDCRMIVACTDEGANRSSEQCQNAAAQNIEHADQTQLLLPKCVSLEACLQVSLQMAPHSGGLIKDNADKACSAIGKRLGLSDAGLSLVQTSTLKKLPSRAQDKNSQAHAGLLDLKCLNAPECKAIALSASTDEPEVDAAEARQQEEIGQLQAHGIRTCEQLACHLARCNHTAQALAAPGLTPHAASALATSLCANDTSAIARTQFSTSCQAPLWLPTLCAVASSPGATTYIVAAPALDDASCAFVASTLQSSQAKQRVEHVVIHSELKASSQWRQELLQSVVQLPKLQSVQSVPLSSMAAAGGKLCLQLGADAQAESNVRFGAVGCAVMSHRLQQLFMDSTGSSCPLQALDLRDVTIGSGMEQLVDGLLAAVQQHPELCQLRALDLSSTGPSSQGLLSLARLLQCSGLSRCLTSLQLVDVGLSAVPFTDLWTGLQCCTRALPLLHDEEACRVLCWLVSCSSAGRAGCL